MQEQKIIAYIFDPPEPLQGTLAETFSSRLIRTFAENVPPFTQQTIEGWGQHEIKTPKADRTTHRFHAEITPAGRQILVEKIDPAGRRPSHGMVNFSGDTIPLGRRGIRLGFGENEMESVGLVQVRRSNKTLVAYIFVSRY